MKYDRIMWDFNGTLLDDMQLGYDCANILLKKYNLPLIPNMEEYRAKFTFPVSEYYHRIGLPPKGVPYDVVAHEWVREYRSREHLLTCREGVEETLQKLKNLGYKMSVLSATEMQMLEEQVSGIGIRSYFDILLGGTDIYAKGKTEIAKKYRVEHPSEKVVMIGDTIHDYDTAMAGGFDCILLSGGHQTIGDLQSCKCKVANSFEELLKLIMEE